LAVDEDRDAAFAARGRELVGGNERIDGRDNEGGLRRRQRDELVGLWCRRGRRSRRLLRLRGSGWGETRGDVLAPNRKLRRAIGLLSSDVLLSAMATSRALPRQSLTLHAKTRRAPRGHLRGGLSLSF
jgi:hypothetical protein